MHDPFRCNRTKYKTRNVAHLLFPYETKELSGQSNAYIATISWCSEICLRFILSLSNVSRNRKYSQFRFRSQYFRVVSPRIVFPSFPYIIALRASSTRIKRLEIDERSTNLVEAFEGTIFHGIVNQRGTAESGGSLRYAARPIFPLERAPTRSTTAISTSNVGYVTGLAWIYNFVQSIRIRCSLRGIRFKETKKQRTRGSCRTYNI